ncbi:hypothetical protein [Streptomyces paromomycinus]|uniref:Uncharacterized protein n=1 Tax=Streptomyces paromomycinus TaxID=92743 RepID=A0A401W0G6_STREY|nr:hypothetical protein [Streptomyces paromomycinus]GCD42824.1 hypothetical protein GKJPGBOP_02498 [Streptomyces paromomycinus]
MEAEEARHVEAVLRRLGVAGIVAPEDPERAAGAWRVYDSPDLGRRKDITPDVLVAVVVQFRKAEAEAGPEAEADPGPARRADGGGPTRGFIIPPGGN